MTTPVARGYPDWVRRAPRSDAIYISDGNNTTSTSVVYGPFYVGDVSGVILQVSAVVHNCKVTLDWGQDSAFALPTLTTAFTCWNSTINPMYYRVAAPYLRVTVSAGSGGAAQYGALMMSADAPTALAKVYTDAALIAQVTVVIGAGASTDVNASRTYVGPAVWSCWGSNSAFQAFLLAGDENGTYNNIDGFDQTAGMHERRVYLPPNQCKIHMTNTGSASANFNVFLLTDVSLAGRG